MRVYADAWRRYYTDEHVETIMRRAIVSGINRTKVLDSLTIFSGAARIEGVHPLQFGFFRRKVRTQRRYGMPVPHPLVFYPWRVVDFLKVTSQWLRLVWRYRRILARVARDPAAPSHFDEALRPHTSPGETDHFVEVFADKIRIPMAPRCGRRTSASKRQSSRPPLILRRRKSSGDLLRADRSDFPCR